MTGAYLLPLNTAAMLFPGLALLISVPVAIVLYRRHGIMTRWRALSIFAFVYFAVSALCLVVVPLPSSAVDVCQAFPTFKNPQWTPGMFVADMWKEAHHQLSFGALILHNSAFWQTVFNLLLLLPLGVFVRLHFRRGLLAATLAGFGASLFFELTQFTGLWGIYPCPYRLFAVDDLLANTAGASLGWALAAPLARFLPELNALDDRAMAASDNVPFGRRLVALLLDVTGLFVVGPPVSFVVTMFSGTETGVLTSVLLTALWFVVVPWLTGGFTPGKRVLLLRLTARDGSRPGLIPLALRAAVLAAPPLVLALGMALVTLRLLEDGAAVNAVALLALAAMLCCGAMVCLVLYLWALRAARRHPEGLGYHEIWSGVANTSLPHWRARKRERAGADALGPDALGPDATGKAGKAPTGR
ncbi:VanZ family protein [Streptomyces benahoarensis]|uniref:Teicoplanin resistance protein VanZ n=1 Tax=Streptomyces benahoarensis TaxID=2595054 RepID=A0A553ZMH6_9ACTN|nr:VanZ family protein [Streptomyces benahoarensis]TSB31736.1 teicoplanin resistance protein VanZ [Streptomyces benahoarensis]TSB42684.1 teicoplanin resistance protein VanZ [Streptomyces benahoarensis]